MEMMTGFIFSLFQEEFSCKLNYLIWLCGGGTDSLQQVGHLRARVRSRGWVLSFISCCWFHFEEAVIVSCFLVCLLPDTQLTDRPVDQTLFLLPDQLAIVSAYLNASSKYFPAINLFFSDLEF